MRARLRVIEVRKDDPVELPDNTVPVRIDPVMEHVGGTIPTPSSERFMLYYLEKES